MLTRSFLIPCCCLPVAFGFLSSPVANEHFSSRTSLEAKKQSRSSEGGVAMADDGERPAGIVGAEFFGGDNVKDELFDPVAEEKIGMKVFVTEDDLYNRFQDTNAFPDDMARDVAQALQSQINAVLYEEEAKIAVQSYQYSPSLAWQTPMPIDKSSKNPLQELEKTLEYYNRVDVAVVSADSSSSGTVTARWEISVVWPNFWQSRVLLTGSSTLTVENDKIVKQVDELDDGNNNVLGTIFKQVTPRFWDVYHIGMTPSAEVTPRLPSVAKKGLFSSYELFEIPSRVVMQPTVADIFPREDGSAQTIPNHAFCRNIMTMGPKKDRYVTTSPVEVQISRGENNQPRISWGIPLTVELQSNTALPTPGDDPDTLEEAMPECKYVYQPRRRVATLPYGGSPQDPEVTEIRKQLYDQVIKDGHNAKLDSNGRPQFLFFQNDAKACYTNGGLGMAVYDWRPKFVKANDVGIELEM